MVLTISYDRTGSRVLLPGKTAKDTVYALTAAGQRYDGPVSVDYYGRPCPPHAHGTATLERPSSSTRALLDAVLSIYDRTVNPELLVRRVTIAAANLIPEEDIPEEPPEQLDLFTDYEALERERKAEQRARERERQLQLATLQLQKKFGKNAVLKGMNLMDGATTMARNGQVGGHKAE
jgi:DNA polymerase V